MIGFNWLIKLPGQPRFPQTEQKSQQSLQFFFSGLRPRLSRLAASLLACLGFSCSNFAKKNKRLLAVYLTASHCTLHSLRAQDFASKAKAYYLLMPGSFVWLSKTNLNPFSFYARLHSL